MLLKRIAVTLLVALAASSFAEDPKAKAAREELEKQLNQMVGKLPTKVRVDFIGLEDPNYRVEEATFELDGRNLGSPTLHELSDEGTHLVWNGDVTPGKHTVKVLLVFSNQASVVLSDEGGYKWKVGGDVSFDVNAGIEVRVQVAPKRDSKQTDVAKRFRLSLPAQPVMIAKLDDGSMPDPMAKPVMVADAGAAAPTAEQLAEEKKKAAELAAAEKKQKAAEAAEAKKQKAAEAAEAKKAAAEAKKQKAVEAAEAKKAALAAKKAAAEEKKRAALEAAEAKKLAAAEEKKRAAQAALEAKNNPPVETAVVDAGAPVAIATAEPLDAGAPEELDAGAPVVAAAPVDAGTPAPVAAAPVEASEGPPWLIIGIAGAVAALIFLIVVARRRSRPPTLDD